MLTKHPFFVIMSPIIGDIMDTKNIEHIFCKQFFEVFSQDDQINIAVAYSGGVDSSVLLYFCNKVLKNEGFKNIKLFAFHVNHGISKNAKDWEMFCRNECLKYGVEFDSRTVSLGRAGKGVECEARDKRYEAICEMCKQHNVRFVLTAHHSGDQIETILLQTFRGTDVSGIVGMKSVSDFPTKEGRDIKLIRLLLDVSKEQIKEYAYENGIANINDESNDDNDYTRNALRNEIIPALKKLFPGFENRLLKTSEKIKRNQQLIDEISRNDLKRCCNNMNININSIKELSDVRMENVLSLWLKTNGIKIPSRKWFDEFKKQIILSNSSSKIELKICDKIIRTYNDEMFLEERHQEDSKPLSEKSFSIEREGVGFRLMGEDGLCCKKTTFGVDVSKYAGKELILRSYKGNIKVKVKNRPSKTLKQLCAENNIPSWKRNNIRVVCNGDDVVDVIGINNLLLEDFVEDGCRIYAM